MFFDSCIIMIFKTFWIEHSTSSFKKISFVCSYYLFNKYGGLTPFAESGPIMIGTGDNVASVTEMIPDERTQGDVSATFKTRFHPNDTEREYGPYTMSNPTSLRLTGRQLRIRVEGERLADWRVGINRIDVVQGGRR